MTVFEVLHATSINPQKASQWTHPTLPTPGLVVHSSRDFDEGRVLLHQINLTDNKQNNNKSRTNEKKKKKIIRKNGISQSMLCHTQPVPATLQQTTKHRGKEDQAMVPTQTLTDLSIPHDHDFLVTDFCLSPKHLKRTNTQT